MAEKSAECASSPTSDSEPVYTLELLEEMYKYLSALYNTPGSRSRRMQDLTDNCRETVNRKHSEFESWEAFYAWVNYTGEPSTEMQKAEEDFTATTNVVWDMVEEMLKTKMPDGPEVGAIVKRLEHLKWCGGTFLKRNPKDVQSTRSSGGVAANH